MTRCGCDNCGHECDVSELKPVQRLVEPLDYPEDDPRCVMPDGEGLLCGCLSYEVSAQDERRAAGASA